MAGVEIAVARIVEPARPGVRRVDPGAGERAVQAPGLKAGAQADERISLCAAIDVGERRRRALQRPVRLDLVGHRRKAVGIADGKARLHDRQRLAVLIDRAERPGG